MRLILEVENDTKPLNGDILVYNSKTGKYKVRPMSYIYKERDKRFVKDEKRMGDIENKIATLESHISKMAKILKEEVENV